MSSHDESEEEPERDELHPNFRAAAQEAAAASAAAYERYNAAVRKPEPESESESESEPEPEPEPERTGSIAPPGMEDSATRAPSPPLSSGGLLGRVRRKLGR